jgi:uncharacterized protein YcsI (UPF0317 family)
MPMNTALSPSELRGRIRTGRWTGDTSGACPGAVQANLVMLPKSQAFDFLLFCVRNPKPCPILDVLDPGRWEPAIAPGADLRRDLPRYRVFRDGILADEPVDVSNRVDSETVSFLLGCSFSFEQAMLANGLPVRNIEAGCNVSMYKTSRPCRPAGPFSAPLVVSMRPMTPEQAVRAVQITTRFHLTHGAPVHMGDPAAIGIADIDAPDFGDPVPIREGEIPVFWACGVTSSLAAVSAGLPQVVTHSPGHMFVSDLKDEEMTIM